MGLAFRFTFAAVLAFALVACSETPAREMSPGLAGAIEFNPEYSVLTRLAGETGLLSMLESGGPYTVLAPTDIAFTYVGAEAFPVLASSEQRPILARMLRHHVIAGRMAPEDFVDGATLTSVEGFPLRVQRVRDDVVIEGATIDLGNASEADNGIAYPASNVIRSNLTVRERIELSPTFSTFARFAEETGILDEADGLAQRTVLIPIDDAFVQIQKTISLLDRSENTDVLMRVIRPHVLPGRIDLNEIESQDELTTLGGQTVVVTREGKAVFIDGSRVFSRGYDAADGRIYLYSSVLFKGISLAERLRVLPQVTIFPGQIREEEDVWARLNDREDALTVFAPNDGAYIRRSGEVSSALNVPENAALLRRTRRVFVAEGRYGPSDLIDGLTIQALDGSELEVQRNGNDIFVGGQRVTSSGTELSNGALYTMQSFIPPTVDPFDTAILKGLTIFHEAVRRAGLETLVREEALSIFAPSNRVFQIEPGLFSNPKLREILLYQMTHERIPFGSPELGFFMLSGDERNYSRRFDSKRQEFYGPVLLDARLPIPDGFDTLDGQSRLFPADTLTYPGKPTPAL